jgi:hypothetical protein
MESVLVVRKEEDPNTNTIEQALPPLAANTKTRIAIDEINTRHGNL